MSPLRQIIREPDFSRTWWILADGTAWWTDGEEWYRGIPSMAARSAAHSRQHTEDKP